LKQEWLSIGFSLLIGAMTLLAGWGYVDTRASLSHQQTLYNIQGRASQVRANLESEMNQRLLMVQGLSAFVQATTSFDDQTFENYARALMAERPYVMSLQLAPDAVMTYVYPYEPNKAIIGHDLKIDPARFGPVREAIENREFRLAGPVDLLQGGNAVIGRLPIYIYRDGEESFWGLATILMDVKSIIADILRRNPLIDTRIAIRGKDGKGAEGGVFHGDERVFSQSPVLVSITLPFGSWQIAAVPLEGWQSVSERLLYFVAIVMGIATAGLVYSVLHFRILSRALLIAKDQAEASEKSKGEFLSTMSHELRTPLNGVIGMAELLESTEQNDEQRSYTHTIISSGKVLLALINDILDLAKFREGKLEFEHQPYNAETSIRETMLSFLAATREKNIPLYFQIYPGTSTHLLGDEVRLRQIVFNLLSNAMKFTNSGYIIVSISSIINNEGRFSLCVSVEDTGIGIDADYLSSMFDKFTQADVSTTRKYGGSGLGLSIIKALIEQMDGNIHAQSVKNKGTIFISELPVEVSPEEPPSRDVSTKVNLIKGSRILVMGSDNQRSKELEVFSNQYSVIIENENDIEQNELENLFCSYDVIVVFRDRQSELKTHNNAVPDLPDSQAMVLIVYGDKSDIPRDALWDRRLNLCDSSVSGEELSEQLIALLYQKHREGALPRSVPIKRDYDFTILLADDNVVNQKVLLGMLRKFNLKASVANNGREALDKASAKEYDVIFMDCEMPVMDGFEASQKILSLEGVRKPTIIALTAHVIGDIEKRCTEAGMTHLVHKPINMKDLEGVFSNL